MEEGVLVARYWCHMCSQVVNPIIDAEPTCPVCLNGFIEEVGSTDATSRGFVESNLASYRALSLWAPILLGIMSNPRRHRRFRRHVLDEDHNEGDHYDDNSNGGRSHEVETEFDRELDTIIRRRRRSSATILQLLQGIRAGMADAENHSENSRVGDRERVIFINPLHQTIIVQGSPNPNQIQNPNSFGSFGDYFIGPGLDMLLQHLADNDPNRYGTPPAQKEAIEALPTVKIKENLQCSVCLDDFDLGAEAIEMPCQHKFHSVCLMPWLELHNSCPVCRHQLLINEPKCDLEGSRNSNNVDEDQNIIGSSENNGREYRSASNSGATSQTDES
ncbi:hypothetical protein Cgig2_016886 [Carnegiea gigantea]|uniref:RING-type E3 ubiquitin transferase n=1 Tax=Carnegiea gigantea TaxID=171969 RepID=A0A9Q1QCF4_9CARY|nr:hypothetical protein Cgig2_016886 [Carnegiea gigantea]